MPLLFRPLFGSKQVLLRSTPKPITPFGGLVSFLEFLHRLALPQQLAATMPFQLRSPNAIPPAHTLTAFMLAVIAGARRFAHTDWLRADKALHTLLGIRRFPGTDTIRNFFRRFSQSSVESFWRPPFRWVLGKFSCPALGFSLDLDSTIFQRAGRQEGAAKGYNLRRPGRRSRHPLLVVLAEAPGVSGRTRSGLCDRGASSSARRRCKSGLCWMRTTRWASFGRSCWDGSASGVLWWCASGCARRKRRWAASCCRCRATGFGSS